MPKLFGLDIAKLVATSLKGAGGLVSGEIQHLVPGARASSNLSGGNQPTYTRHACQGFVEYGVFGRSGRRPDSTVPTYNAKVSILGADVFPPVVPYVNDRVTFEGRTFLLLQVIEADPAGAMYVFGVEEV